MKTTRILALPLLLAIAAPAQKPAGKPTPRSEAEALRALLESSLTKDRGALLAKLRTALSSCDPEWKPRLRIRIAQILAENGDPSSGLAELRQVESEPGNPELRERLRREVEKLKELLKQQRAKTERKDEKSSKDPLAVWLDAIDAPLREKSCQAALRELRELGPLAVPSLLRNLEELGPFGRRNAMQLLAEYATPESIARMESCLTDKDSPLAAAAAEWLHLLPRQDAVRLGRLAMNSSEGFVQLHGIAAVIEHGGDPDGALQKLRPLFRDGSSTLRHAAIEMVLSSAKLAGCQAAFEMLHSAVLQGQEPLHQAYAALCDFHAKGHNEELLELYRATPDRGQRERFLKQATTAHDDESLFLPSLLVQGTVETAAHGPQWNDWRLHAETLLHRFAKDIPDSDFPRLVGRVREVTARPLVSELLRRGGSERILLATRFGADPRTSAGKKLIAALRSLNDADLQRALLAYFESTEWNGHFESLLLGLAWIRNLDFPVGSLVQFAGSSKFWSNTITQEHRERFTELMARQIGPEDLESLRPLVRIPSTHVSATVWPAFRKLACKLIESAKLEDLRVALRSWPGRVDRHVESDLLRKAGSLVKAQSASLMETLLDSWGPMPASAEVPNTGVGYRRRSPDAYPLPHYTRRKIILQRLGALAAENEDVRTRLQKRLQEMEASSHDATKSLASEFSVRSDFVGTEFARARIQKALAAGTLPDLLDPIGWTPLLDDDPKLRKQVMSTLAAAWSSGSSHASKAVYRLESDERSAVLEQLLVAENPYIPAANQLVVLIAEEKNAKHVGPLAAAARHRSALVASAGVQGLLRTWSPDAIPGLLDALRHDDMSVRKEARAALDELHGYLSERARWNKRFEEIPRSPKDKR